MNEELAAIKEELVDVDQIHREREELRALVDSLFVSQEEERRRVARELHDDLSQRLAALEIEGDQLQRKIETDVEAAKAGCTLIRSRIAALSDDVRALSHRLQPSIIEDLGLKAALRSLTQEFGQRENVIATFSPENVPDNIPLETATALYRITQESLQNVGKHAGKTHVRVSLKGTPHGIQLRIADSGRGFDIESVRRGLGLISIEQRTRQIGGTLQVKSAAAKGTSVTIDVKLTVEN